MSSPEEPDSEHEESGFTLEKLAALSAAILLVSLGLCGANFLLVLRFVPLSGPGPQPGHAVPPEWPGTVLGITGFLEFVGMGVGIAGLLAAFLRALWR